MRLSEVRQRATVEPSDFQAQRGLRATYSSRIELLLLDPIFPYDVTLR